MIIRVVIPLLLLPLLVIALPLMFALAWLREAVGDLAPARQVPEESWEIANIISSKKQ